MAKDDIDKMLQDIDTGKAAPSTLKDARQTMPSQPLPRPSMPEGPRGGQIKYKDYAPKDISPHGDLGMLDDKEQKAFFKNPIKGADAEWQSSKHIPVGNKPRVACDASYMKPRVDYASSVYPKHDKSDYSGLKAGSKVGGSGKNQRGVTAKDHGMTNDYGFRNPDYGYLSGKEGSDAAATKFKLNLSSRRQYRSDLSDSRGNRKSSSEQVRNKGQESMNKAKSDFASRQKMLRDN